MEGDLQQAVGRNLRAYREQQGLSQEKFADELGVHRTYMGGIERGERNLTLKSLEAHRRAAAAGPTGAAAAKTTRHPARSRDHRSGHAPVASS